MHRTLAQLSRAGAWLLLGAGLAATTGCEPGAGGTDTSAARDGEPGGTIIMATASDAGAILPAFGDREVDVQVTSMLFDRLAALGDDMNVRGDAGFTPLLAERWKWSADSLAIAFHLHPRARWHDGRPVRASDVRFSWQLYADSVVGSPVRALIANIDSVSVRDSLTAVFHFERRMPDQFFEAAYQVIPMPEHLLKDANRAELRAASFSRSPVGNGRFRFGSWTPGQRIELVADTANYRGRPKVDRVVIAVYPDPAAGIAALMAGQADFYPALSVDQMREVSGNPDLKAVSYPSLDYAFVHLNTRGAGGRGTHPILGDREVRRALTMALDRQAMVKNVFDTMAYVPLGPVPRGLKPDTSGLRQLPFDRARANAILDSLGWRDANGDSVREKNGRPLEFSLLVPASSAPRRRYGVLLQEQFRQAGVKVNLEQLDFNVFIDRQLKRDFDAALGFFHTDPAPGSIRQVWGTAGIGGEGSNYGGYSNPAFDAAVDSSLSTMDAAAGSRHLARAYQIIVDDAPAIWLYEPRLVAGMHRRIQPVGMRADGWYGKVAEWSIPTGLRIPRDRIPLDSAAR